MQTAFPRHDPAQRRTREEKLLADLTERRRGTLWGCREAGTLTAAVRLIPFEMALGGRWAPAMGIGALAVHPLHRRQGLARRLLERVAELGRQSGAVLLVLYPFSPGFYRKLGFGPFSELYRFRLFPGRLSRCPADGRASLAGPEERREAAAFYREWARGRDGMLTHSAWDEERLAEGGIFVVHRDGAGALDGYLRADLRAAGSPCRGSVLTVREMVWAGGPARGALLGVLAGLEDQCAWIDLYTPFRDDLLLSDDPDDGGDPDGLPDGIRRYGTFCGGCMARILDLASFHSLTANPGPFERELTVRLELDGPEPVRALLRLSRTGAVYPAGKGTEDAVVRGALADHTAFAAGMMTLEALCRHGRLAVDPPVCIPELQRRLGRLAPPACFTYF